MKFKLLLSVAVLALSTAANALPVLQNTSFETNNVGTGYKYAGLVTATGWNFTGGAGVSVDSSAWSGYTPSGNYHAFLQNTASISQQFVSTGGIFDLSFLFDVKERTNHGSLGAQVLSVKLDGVQIGTYQPLANGNWFTVSAAVAGITAGNHTLEFLGTNPSNAADTTIFFDNVRMTATEVIQPNASVPEPASLALLGLALAGLGVSRRKQKA